MVKIQFFYINKKDMNNNKYILKYNQKGELYHYVELNKNNKMLYYIKIEDKKLIRFDKYTHTKQLMKFKTEVKLKQKFISDESFVSVFDIHTNECVQHNISEIEKKITLIKNNVYMSDFGKYVVEKWKQTKKDI